MTAEKVGSGKTYIFGFFNLIPGIVTVKFMKFDPPKSSQCTVYPLILDCAVNDMVDTTGEDGASCSTVNTPIVTEVSTPPLLYGIAPICVPLSLYTLHISRNIPVPVTVH